MYVAAIMGRFPSVASNKTRYCTLYTVQTFLG
jgi:hypothetical protein